MTLTPRLDVLPPPQRALWPELGDVPRDFVLYGGTALALRVGHRVSVDFDFFSWAPLDHALLDALPFMRGSQTLQDQPNTRTVTLDRGGPVKVSFFGGLAFGQLASPDRTDDGVLVVASLLDLAGTKLKALLQRVESKDYRDIVALLDAGVPIDHILGAASALFGAAFNPLVAQKALTYFVGGDLDTLDASVRARLTAACGHDIIPAHIERASTRIGE